MILLDTNVLSELMRPMPNSDVVNWLDAYPEMDVWISSVTVAEIRMGILRLPNGKRRHLLLNLYEQLLEDEFRDRCLPFDCEAAAEYAMIVSERIRLGRPIGVEDAQIAAVAVSADLTLATRNIRDFNEIPRLELVNPWPEG